MGIQERRDRHRGELKSLIMDTARRLFAAEGYHAVSMRRIADAIEYSPTAIYVHFKDKESLIRQLCMDDFGTLATRFLQLAKTKDPIERIREAGRLYIQFAVEHPNHYKLMFMTELGEAVTETEDENNCGKGNPEEDAYAFLLHSVNEAMAAKRFRPELKDPQLIAQTFWAMVHGVASLQIVKGSDDWMGWADLESRTKLAVDTAIRGLRVETKKLIKPKRAGK